MISSDTVSQRLLSLDALRGATIAGMILVNNPGSWQWVYPQLRHAAWHGWTFTDWIFPFFLFVLGVAVTFSFSRRREQGSKLLPHILRRSAILFVLGLVINGFPFGLLPGHEFAWDRLRIPGVLQRIAVCYAFAGAIYINTTLRSLIVWIMGLLAGYWLLVAAVPVPGYGAGVMEPVGNLCWYVDSLVLAGHTWAQAPAPGFDPEGILSTIPALATTLFGVLTGIWLRTERSGEEKTAWMYAAGCFLLLLGVVMDIWLPINKNLWTSSYSVFTAGWALLSLATFYWLIECNRVSRWAGPFVTLGMNPIIIFVVSELLATFLWTVSWHSAGSVTTLHDVIYDHLCKPFFDPFGASLAFALMYVLLMYLLAWVMAKNRWVVKL